MIKPLELLIELDDPNAENLRRIAYAVNAIIEHVNVLSGIQDRKYATNHHARILSQEFDPNKE